MVRRNHQAPGSETIGPVGAGPVVDPTKSGIAPEQAKTAQLVESLVNDSFQLPEEPWTALAVYNYLSKEVVAGSDGSYTIGSVQLSAEARKRYIQHLNPWSNQIDDRRERERRKKAADAKDYGNLPQNLQQEMRGILELKHQGIDVTQLDAACADAGNLNAYKVYLNRRRSLSRKLAIGNRMDAVIRKLESPDHVVTQEYIEYAQSLLKEQTKNKGHGMRLVAEQRVQKLKLLTNQAKDRVVSDANYDGDGRPEEITWYGKLARKAGKFALAKAEQLAVYTGNHLKEYLKTPQGKKVVLTAGACALGYIMLRGGDKKDR